MLLIYQNNFYQLSLTAFTISNMAFGKTSCFERNIITVIYLFILKIILYSELFETKKIFSYVIFSHVKIYLNFFLFIMMQPQTNGYAFGNIKQTNVSHSVSFTIKNFVIYTMKEFLWANIFST